jgi:hypothetical protein
MGKKSILCLLILIVLIPCAYPQQRNTKTNAADSVPADAAKLVRAYKNVISGFANNHIVFKDKSTMAWDDGIKNKSVTELLEKPDLEDMFVQAYIKGIPTSAPPKNFDPGRVRHEAFFMKVYGSSAAEVEKNLTTIVWCPKLVGQTIRITRVNEVDKKLMQVSEELDEHPEWKKYLVNIGGTFLWRNIHGTNRHSMHSFGMTVDINTDYSDYWEWACHCTDESNDVKYKNRIPQGIVDVFEKYGFIWGGKWYHYDTMHFEYRPELLN